MHSKDDIAGDARFSKVFGDSKFKRLPKRKGKVKIDKRFQSMFTDDAFQVKYSVDKRGRRVAKNTTEDLNKFYHLSSDESDTEAAPDERSEDDESDSETASAERLEDDETPDEKTKLTKEKARNDFSLTREEEDMIKKKQISGKVRKKLKDMNVDYARGEGKLFSESSSDESESEGSEPELDHKWNELDKDVDSTENVTKRLAVCNMDWDKVRAEDLMALFKSFLPLGGDIQSVIIYPSEFGLQRLAEEEVKGPAELVNEEIDSSSESDSGDEDEEGKQYHMERLREYQLNRLKYYYAVVTFNSPQTADEIYNACNGIEYCKSGILLDLRFIDDDMTFDQEPKEVCNSINLNEYKPLEFVNTALQQTKVELTWDETDPQRKELMHNISEAALKGDVRDADLENLVALSGSDDDEGDDLLEVLMKNSAPEEMGTFQQLLEKREAFKRKREQEEKEETASDIHSEDENDNRKKKSKRSKQDSGKVDTKKQKAELELLLLEENDEDKNRSHFNLKRKKQKLKKDQKKQPSTDDFEVNVEDDRFSALYSSHLFNVDPTDPNYRKTKGMQAFVEEKQKRLSKRDSEPSRNEAPGRSENAELSRLVKSVKSKTKSYLEKSVKNKMNK